MAAGAGPGAAETYLRLMAEAELRRALAYPRYQPPRQRGPRSPVRAAEAISEAAVLPEVDGARFALAGLRSAADSATVHALAGGWQPDHRALGGERFSWWARDDAGRWQVAAQGGHSHGGGQVDMELQFVPPLHPSARSLDVFVVGPASQAAVTVPLDWAATG